MGRQRPLYDETLIVVKMASGGLFSLFKIFVLVRKTKVLLDNSSNNLSFLLYSKIKLSFKKKISRRVKTSPKNGLLNSADLHLCDFKLYC